MPLRVTGRQLLEMRVLTSFFDAICPYIGAIRHTYTLLQSTTDTVANATAHINACCVAQAALQDMKPTTRGAVGARMSCVRTANIERVRTILRSIVIRVALRLCSR